MVFVLNQKSVTISRILGWALLMYFSFTSATIAGDLKLQIYEGLTEDGGVQDRCLETETPVVIRKVDHGLYSVNVKKGWTGRVKANSYGEARNIACRKKSRVILYGYEGNEPFK